MSFAKRTDGDRISRAMNEKVCANCVFFSPMSASPRDKWTGLCKRFPTHQGVNHSHTCGEFTSPGDIPIGHCCHKPGVCPYAGGPHANECVCAELRFESSRPLGNYSPLGNYIVELSPHEAETVKQAIAGYIAFLRHVDGIALGIGRLTDDHARRIERLERISTRIPN